MQRYKMFDPVEYQKWELDEDVYGDYVLGLEKSPFQRELQSINPQKLIDLYCGMIRFRLHDIMLKRWVRQGVIGKAWLGTGEEAVAIGAVHALKPEDVIAPMIRNAGACHEHGMPLELLFKAYLGSVDTPMKGRDLHAGDLSKGIMPPISHVGALVPVCAGIALAFRQRGEERICLTWVGDGSVRTGEFHEGTSIAVMLKSPLVIFIQNNQVALGTTLKKHTPRGLGQIHRGYGIGALRCNGNSVLEVYAAAAIARRRALRDQRPFIVYSDTFRMGGHATHDEAESRKIIEPSLFEYWGKRDPIALFETYLQRYPLQLDSKSELSNNELLQQCEQRVLDEIEMVAKKCLDERQSKLPTPDQLVDGVFAE